MRTPLFSRLLLLTGLALITVATSRAYELSGSSWASGTVFMQLQLGTPSSPLLDGSTRWDDVAGAALERWNAHLGRVRLSGVKTSSAPQGSLNGYNNVAFSTHVYGEPFGGRVLGITLTRTRGSGATIETDVIINSAETWNSYRGNLRYNSHDLERVLLHEFGHVLGLDHPDQANPAQSVAAVMNSHIGNVYTPQPDDIAGAAALYGAISTAPISAAPLSDQSLATGAPLTLAYSASGSNFTYTWTFKPAEGTERELLNGDGEPWTQPTFSLFSTQPSDSGTYTVTARNAAGATTTSAAQVTVAPVSTANALLANLSSRGRAGSGADTFIVGFVVTGTTPKQVLVRAVGPTLASQGVARPLADPRLTLYQFVNGVSTRVGENDDWSANSSAAQTLRTAAQRLGAFALPDGSKDAALLVTLDPGVYMAHADSKGAPAGIALVEAYDADGSLAQSLPRRLLNLSTRSFTGAGEELLIAGFVVSGTTPKQVLLRAIGPGLTARGVPDVNPDPYLNLYRGSVRIADNDDWYYSNQRDILPAAFRKVGTSPLEAESYDSALLITLPPGVYSATVAGRSGETGAVLLEVFEVVN